MVNGRVQDKVAIVTGGAIGLGAGYTRALAEQGAKVVIADIVDGQTFAKELEQDVTGCKIISITTDISDENSVSNMVNETIQQFGKVDILVNNAALFSTLPPIKFTDIDVELWDKVMAINVRGTFLVSKHVAPYMIKQHYGKIINIGSTVANKGMSDMLHYVTSKAAVLGITRALSRELGEHNICVNTLAPGLTLSDSITKNNEHIDLYRDKVVQSRALKRDGYPEDLIGALLFLASSDSDFITGQTIPVEGGAVNV